MATFEEYGGWPALLTHLLERNHLTSDQAYVAMSEILSGDATPAQLIGFVVALRAKGESSEEMAGLLDAVLEHGQRVPLTDEQRDRLIDIVGTGGDRSHSINVSTMAALVCAGAGAVVCKHGARSASSKAGSADVLEALGVELELSPEGVRQCVDEAGMGFCYAPAFHPAFRFAGPSRREIGVPTVFNLLGPMANPGRVRRQVIGVANGSFAERMISTLEAHGSTHAWVVHGNGLDELSTTGTSDAIELRNGTINHLRVDPADYDLPIVNARDLVGGDVDDNARIVRTVLEGAPGPHRDIVVLNAGAGLVVAGMADDLADGITKAGAAIDDGRAAAALERLVTTSKQAVG